MAAPADHAQAILDLEARHDELLELLSDLENRVASVLAQYQVGRQEVGPVRFPQVATAASEPVRAEAA
jgi:hypothetical protein